MLTNGGGCGGGGGSLGLVVARGISRQLIGAVAFLHGHAGEREGGRGEKEGSRVSPFNCIIVVSFFGSFFCRAFFISITRLYMRGASPYYSILYQSYTGISSLPTSSYRGGWGR